MTPMTSEKYVEYNGLRCPVCGEPGVEGGSIDIIGTEAIQKTWCIYCDHMWHSIYKLAGYELIEQGEVSE